MTVYQILLVLVVVYTCWLHARMSKYNSRFKAAFEVNNKILAKNLENQLILVINTQIVRLNSEFGKQISALNKEITMLKSKE